MIREKVYFDERSLEMINEICRRGFSFHIDWSDEAQQWTVRIPDEVDEKNIVREESRTNAFNAFKKVKIQLEEYDAQKLIMKTRRGYLRVLAEGVLSVQELYANLARSDSPKTALKFFESRLDQVREILQDLTDK